MAFATEPKIKKEDFFHELERELNETVEKDKKMGTEFMKVLRGVRWIKLDSKPPFICFEWEKLSSKFDFLDLVYAFSRSARQNRTRFVFAIDEAQEFRKLEDYDIRKVIHYIYENIQEIQMIITGSQFGSLHEFLGVDDPKSPLYGRGMLEIRTPKISEELAADFLLKGFKQIDLSVAEEVLNAAIRELGGSIGWLTFFGWECRCAKESTMEVLKKTIEKGSKLAMAELKNFLKTTEQNREKYIKILEIVARLKKVNWIALKMRLALFYKSFSSTEFRQLIENLVKSDFMMEDGDGTYSISDPLLSYALLSNQDKW